MIIVETTPGTKRDHIHIIGLKSNSQPDKGQPLLDKVQPDMDELDELTKKEEVKNLGKLQYSLDYDFQQNNVSVTRSIKYN